MEEEFEKRGACPRLLDLISTKKEWVKSDGGAGGKSFVVAEEKLELRLGPPGGEDMPILEEKVEKSPSFTSLSCFSTVPNSSNITILGAKKGPSNTVVPQPEELNQQQPRPFQLQIIASLGKASSQKTNEVAEEEQSLHRKAHAPENGSLGKNRAQTRTTSTPSVGWPPVRSFRKNLASNSSKSLIETQNGASQIGFKVESFKKGLFLKINMDGIPIGRKVDLNACNSYMKLASAVKELFCGLLTAQKDLTLPGKGMSEDEKLAFTGLLDGTGEYTLIYEDNEGDRMLVGDVPWDMFISTAKRLRVLKSSELSDLAVSIARS